MAEFFKRETGLELTPIFDQYLRHAAIPVLELKFDEDGNSVAYRWRADVEDFAMPIKVGDPAAWQTITPTGKWQTLKTSLALNDLQVATDLYYVDVEKSRISVSAAE